MWFCIRIWQEHSQMLTKKAILSEYDVVSKCDAVCQNVMPWGFAAHKRPGKSPLPIQHDWEYKPG